MSAELTVFVVDDDPAALDSVAALARSMWVRTATFTSAEDFLARYDRSERGCLVTDVRMPGMSGLELQAKLQSEGINLPVIVSTAYAQVQLAVKSMRQGAVTFLEKSAGEHELWEAINSALAQERTQLQADSQVAEVRKRYEALSPDELAVLELLLEGHPNKLIGVRLGIALRTVEKRRAAVLKKMEVDSIAELVREVTLLRGAGQ